MMMMMMMTLSLSLSLYIYICIRSLLSLSLCLLIVTTIYDPVMDDSTDSKVKEDAETCRQLLDDSWLGTAMTYRQNPTERFDFSPIRSRQIQMGTSWCLRNLGNLGRPQLWIRNSDPAQMAFLSNLWTWASHLRPCIPCWFRSFPPIGGEVERSWFRDPGALRRSGDEYSDGPCRWRAMHQAVSGGDLKSLGFETKKGALFGNKNQDVTYQNMSW